MNTYIGIDLGTSGVKTILVDKSGNILSQATETYDCVHLKDDYSEQNPNIWFENTIKCLKKLLINQDKNSVKAISFGGQMHGLVTLGENDEIIRPAILWNDGRSVKEVEYLNNIIGKKITDLTGNIAFAGFTAPKILWMRENEPDLFKKVKKIMLPKDYLIYKFSNVFASDVSDASGTLYFDVKNRCYSSEMLEICGIDINMLPKIYESYEVIGSLSKEIYELLGLNQDVKIIAGAGDNAAAAIGTGTIHDGDINISLGTSGTIFIATKNFSVDSKNALHSFCDSTGHYHLMGCILSAASCRSWWLEEILKDNDYQEDENSLKDSEVIFLPYLMGERCQHNDVNARGAFINLSLNTKRGEISKAILEGVAFALKDCFDAASLSGTKPSSISLCGGGARSETWKQIIADVFDIPVKILKTNQGPSYGAAILAMVGSKEYDSLEDAIKSIIKTDRVILPNKNHLEYYKRKYSIYKKLYPALKELENNNK